jgi:hypothetical protein
MYPNEATDHGEPMVVIQCVENTSQKREEEAWFVNGA